MKYRTSKVNPSSTPGKFGFVYGVRFSNFPRYELNGKKALQWDSFKAALHQRFGDSFVRDPKTAILNRGYHPATEFYWISPYTDTIIYVKDLEEFDEFFVEYKLTSGTLDD